MPRDLAADPAAIAGSVRAAGLAASVRAAAHSGRPDRFEAATAAPVAVQGRRAAVRVARPTVVPAERTALAATVATAGLAVVRHRRAAARVAHPTAGPAVKQVRRDCEKAGRPAAIAAELEPDFATAIAGSVRAAGLVQVAVPTAEEHRKGSPEPGAAGFVAEPVEQYFDRGSSYLAVVAVVAVGEEAAAPIADEAPAAGWEWERIPAVPIVAVRVAAAVAVVPTAVARAAVAAVAVVPTAAEQAEARGTGQAEAASTAAASLAQAATEQLVPG